MGNSASCQSTQMLGTLLGTVCGKIPEDEAKNEENQIKGTVVLQKKNVMDAPDVFASVLDRLHEAFGKGVSLQLISSVHGDPAG